MESAGVYRFLTQIPTCWITGKVVRWLSGTYLPDIFSVKLDITGELLMERAFISRIRNVDPPLPPADWQWYWCNIDNDWWLFNIEVFEDCALCNIGTVCLVWVAGSSGGSGGRGFQSAFWLQQPLHCTSDNKKFSITKKEAPIKIVFRTYSKIREPPPPQPNLTEPLNIEGPA